jgi:hypothetical protein
LTRINLHSNFNSLPIKLNISITLSNFPCTIFKQSVIQYIISRREILKFSVSIHQINTQTINYSNKKQIANSEKTEKIKLQHKNEKWKFVLKKDEIRKRVLKKFFTKKMFKNNSMKRKMYKKRFMFPLEKVKRN